MGTYETRMRGYFWRLKSNFLRLSRKTKASKGQSVKFINSFIQQIVFKCLLCDKHCSQLHTIQENIFALLTHRTYSIVEKERKYHTQKNCMLDCDKCYGIKRSGQIVSVGYRVRSLSCSLKQGDQNRPTLKVILFNLYQIFHYTLEQSNNKRLTD